MERGKTKKAQLHPSLSKKNEVVVHFILFPTKNRVLTDIPDENQR